MNITLNLNEETASVLNHCLNYGENATSVNDEKSGKAEYIRSCIGDIRKQLLNAIIDNGEIFIPQGE